MIVSEVLYAVPVRSMLLEEIERYRRRNGAAPDVLEISRTFHDVLKAELLVTDALRPVLDLEREIGERRRVGLRHGERRLGAGSFLPVTGAVDVQVEAIGDRTRLMNGCAHLRGNTDIRSN